MFYIRKVKYSVISKFSKIRTNSLNSTQFTVNNGFTLIELMVVISLMMVILSLVIIDFSKQRRTRGLTIAQNELVTNIRKVQSNSLFSPNIGGSKPAQYYILKVSTSTPEKYFIEAITDVNISPILHKIETINLPQNVRISSVTIKRPLVASENSACALLAFKVPFGKVYVNNGCQESNFDSFDDYQKIISHITNISGQTVSTDTDLVIALTHADSEITKQVMVKGVTGLVCPTKDGIVCGF